MLLPASSSRSHHTTFLQREHRGEKDVTTPGSLRLTRPQGERTAKEELLQCGGLKGQCLPESRDHEVVQSNRPLRDQAEGGGAVVLGDPKLQSQAALIPSEQLHSLGEFFLSSTS